MERSNHDDGPDAWFDFWRGVRFAALFTLVSGAVARAIWGWLT